MGFAGEFGAVGEGGGEGQFGGELTGTVNWQFLATGGWHWGRGAGWLGEWEKEVELNK